MNRNTTPDTFTPLGDDVRRATGAGLTTERITLRVDRSLVEAAERACQKVKPKRKPHWWLTRWVEMGAAADGVKLFDVDGAPGDGEFFESDEWFPCTILATGPEHVTVGIDGRVVTVSPELVRRREAVGAHTTVSRTRAAGAKKHSVADVLSMVSLDE